MTTSHRRQLSGALALIAVLAVGAALLVAFGARLPIASALTSPGGSSTGGPTTSDNTDRGQVNTANQVRERGNAIRCTAQLAGHEAYVELYENSHYGNSVQIVLDDDGLGAGRETVSPLVTGEQVHGSVVVDGTRAVVSGTATRNADKIPVAEEFDHAGEHLTTSGFRRSLTTDLTLRYGASTVPLSCDDAFHFVLDVTREKTTD